MSGRSQILSHRFLIALALVALLVSSRPLAGTITDQRGDLALRLTLRKLASIGTVMHVTAHPDDENSALMAMESHGQGMRVVLATATRGNGGQNEIGPEIFEALGVLRTEELLAAHRYDGAEQFFARAVDFGFSFSVDETYQKWGHDEILGDYVRLIRMTRPDLMLTMRPDGAGGGQHHQAAARIGLEAFRAAADPAKYPEQIKEGLRPWQPAKIYQAVYYSAFQSGQAPPTGRLVTVDGNTYDPLLGRTYAEIGSEARAMHKCQGFGQLLALPGPSVVMYRLADSSLPGQMDKDEASLDDGLSTRLASLARFGGDTPNAALVSGLAAIDAAVAAAGDQLRTGGPQAAVAPLAAGLTAARSLRETLSQFGLSDTAIFEIDFRLAQTVRKFESALVLAQGLRLEALANGGVVTPGQPLKVTLIAANRGSQPLTAGSPALMGVEGAAPQCQTGALAPGAQVQCETAVTVPAGAAVTEPYWTRAGDADRYVFAPDAPFGLPFRPTPFRARFAVTIGGVDVPVDLPIVNRYEGNIFSGEKRTELLVVPALSVKVTPEIAIVPLASGVVHTSSAGHAPSGREVTVTVTNNAPAPSQADISLAVPQGWRVEPVSAKASLARAGEAATLRFTVSPTSAVKEGTYPVTAKVVSGDRMFSRGYDAIEYPHTRRQHIYADAAVTIKAIDVRLTSKLTVGYVMGVGDQVPPAIEQLGATVHLLTDADLASGDLTRYDVIVTGVRAYERRRDLRAYNQRLIDFAERGGTVIVQYNKFEFNQAQYGPYPAKVSGDRVTDEHAPVTVLVPDHPVFNQPNKITAAAWDHWVQERGLYFLGERDPRYVDLVEATDPFPFNAGAKRGALVEARVGTGRWVYVGLNLWRQLPAGTEGAYELLANLLSLGATESKAVGVAQKAAEGRH